MIRDGGMSWLIVRRNVQKIQRCSFPLERLGGLDVEKSRGRERGGGSEVS
jgi:hypothetical protein